jgi:hypothetical protein
LLCLGVQWLCIIIKCCMPKDFFIYYDYIIFSKRHSFVGFRGIKLSPIPHYKWGSWVHCNINLETILLIFVNMWYVIFNLYIGLNCIIILINLQIYANINILGCIMYMCVKTILDNNWRNNVWWNRTFLLVKSFKLVTRPLDKGLGQRQMKLWFSLHGIILERKPIGLDQKKKLKGKLMV